MDVQCRGMVGPIKDGCDDFLEFVFVNSFDFCTIGCAQDDVEDGTADDGVDGVDGFGYALLHANDGLVDRILMVGLFGGVCS